MLTTEQGKSEAIVRAKQQPDDGRLGRDLTFTLLAGLLVKVAFGFSEPLMVFYYNFKQFSPLDYGLLTAAIYASQTLTAPLMGVLADRIGRRNLLLLTIGGGLLAVQIPPLTIIFPLLLLNRLLAGAANVGSTAALLTLVTDETSGGHPKRRGRATTLYQGVELGGQLIGLVLASQLFSRIAINSFYVATAVYFLTILIIWWRVPETRRGRLASGPAEEAQPSGWQETLANWKMLFRSRKLWSFLPVWLVVNAILGMWYAHAGVQLLKNPTASNQRADQFLMGRFTAGELGLVFLVYAAIFGTGLAIWSRIISRWRYAYVMLLASICEITVCVSLLAYNGVGSAGGLAWLLLVPAGLAVMVESGFTPAALGYLTDIAEQVGGERARGTVMGFYSTGNSLGNIIGTFFGILMIQFFGLGLNGLLIGSGLLGVGGVAAVLFLIRRENQGFK